MSELVEIALPLNLPGPLTYEWHMDKPPIIGARVVVPVGKREMAGIIWRTGATTTLDPEQLRPVRERLDTSPLLPEFLMEFLEWTADYYFYPLGLAVSESMPPGFMPSRSRQIESLITNPIRQGRSRFEINSWNPGNVRELSSSQSEVLSTVERALRSGEFSPILLHGVTGSGKTEVYIRAVKRCLELGRTALVLVPEIAMTSQISSWFMDRFGRELSLLHSGLTNPQRRDHWFRIRQGESSVVIGTRSGIFAPLDNIGLIIVDEEHDPSYKQDDKFLYNARDLALVRGKMAGATVLLGSATPSVTTFFHALSGKFTLAEMKERVSHRRLPDVKIVDRRLGKDSKKKPRQGIRRWLSARLEQAVRETLARGEQAIIFLNRRGFATYVFCPDCGHVFSCRNCDLTMTWHRKGPGSGREGSCGGLLKCHYCGDEAPGMQVCPECGGHGVKATGFGTEKVADELGELLPQARITRIDRDTSTSRKRLEATLSAFRRHEYDILVGTQMITKGHDFPDVTLVGIVVADSALNIPEYNASERTFQLISQVAGRAGRGEKPGRVFIQTFAPDHYSIEAASSHDYAAFYDQECSARNPLSYPPYGNMINIRFSGVKKADVQEIAGVAAYEIRNILKDLSGKGRWPVEILGPAPASRARLNNRYRFNLLIKSPSRQAMREVCRKLLEKRAEIIPGRIRMDIDVDPVNFA